MSAFSVNEAASMEIRRILRQSTYRDPVARLYERADPGQLFDEVKAVLMEGTTTKVDVEAIARKRFAEVGDQLESALMVGACERADFRPEDLCEANGITFALGPAFIALLREYCLTFEDGRFALRSADNVAHTLRSLVMSANSKGSAPRT
jgi:hypothetical protein